MSTADGCISFEIFVTQTAREVGTAAAEICAISPRFVFRDTRRIEKKNDQLLLALWNSGLKRALANGQGVVVSVTRTVQAACADLHGADQLKLERSSDND